jgi:hypothetical protein
MAGRPNFPEDVDSRDRLKAAALNTPGLTALDEEREASLADEGGAAGARVETQDEEARERLTRSLPVSHLVVCDDDCTIEEHGHDEEGEVSVPMLLALGGAVVAAALGLLLLRRS